MAWQEYKTDAKDWKGITDKTAALMLDQSNNYLKETLETSKTISARADRLVSIQITIMTAIIIYVLNNLSSWRSFLGISGIICLIITIISFYFSIRNFIKYSVAVSGEEPKQILNADFVDNSHKGNDQYVHLIVALCENIQRKIDMNKAQNAKRMRNNTIASMTLLFIPLGPIISCFLSGTFPSHCS